VTVCHVGETVEAERTLEGYSSQCQRLWDCPLVEK